MSKTARILVIVGGSVVFLAIVVVGALLVLSRLPWPQTGGRIVLEGLSAPVEILRDRSGVPHIYARTSNDLFFAEGFVHAQDRFWQMEFWRRISSGRLSELLGKKTLETDKFMRTLGFRQVAAREIRQLTPEARQCLDAYAAGVNAYVLHRAPARLGLEFTLLQLQGAKITIEPWTPEDSVAWGTMMAYDLCANHETEQLHVEILRSAGSAGWASLFAPFRPDMPYTINSEELRKIMGSAGGPAGGRADSAAAVLLAGSREVGSNNWVVSGRRTASGKPILANDMHLGIQMPSIWYEVGLHGMRPDGTAGRTDACPFSVLGYSFPGTPGVIAGHNDRIAWGLTNLGGDVQDFFIEKINPANPDQYEVNGRWVDMDIRVETIKVAKAGEPVVIRARSTRHGPVLSDRALWSGLAGFTVTPGREFPDGVGLTAASLRWTALQPSRLFDAIVQLDSASSFAEFRAALRSWDVPAQNVVYADVDGNIGYQVPGLQPIRAHGHGLVPSPGWTDDNEWTGFIPFYKLPWMYNPDQGCIVTANAPIVGPGYPFYLGSEFSYGERSRRIRELIEAAGPRMSVPDMIGIQGDVYDQNASEVVPYLRGLDISAGQKPEEPPWEKDRAAMTTSRDRLLSWDFHMGRRSPEAALYAFFWMALVEETFRDQYPENRWPPESGSGRFQNSIHYLLQDPQNVLWDDRGTPGVRETRDRIMARAFRRGWRAAVTKLGRNLDGWQWGKVHTATFRNMSLGRSGIALIERIFNRGPVEMAGGLTTVSVMQWDMGKPFEIKHIASQRMIVDLADWGASLMVNTTGQSGHPWNRHYDDNIASWQNGLYHPALWERAAVEKDSRERLILTPPARPR